jgi:hypothetical protein
MKHLPGHIVPNSGIYAEYNKYDEKGMEITCIFNELFPSCEQEGNYYMAYRLAKHKPSRG